MVARREIHVSPVDGGQDAAADYAAHLRGAGADVEAALASQLSPDAAERLEAAHLHRLDRLTRAIEFLERHKTIGNEALAQFIRF